MSAISLLIALFYSLLINNCEIQIFISINFYFFPALVDLVPNFTKHAHIII